jgi:very-short-patch-repair endonuclease
LSVERARRLRSGATKAERLLWCELRAFKKQGFHFRRQVPLGRYIVDFACHRAKVVVEVDGLQHAMPREARHDALRTEFLETQGYTVLRFWNLDVLEGRGYVIEVIAKAMKTPVPEPPPEAPPALRPPHKGEAGNRG